jgi:hypothetical protein
MAEPCFTFDSVKETVSGGTKPAGQVFQVSVPPARWMEWMMPQRITYLRTVVAIRPGESTRAYDARLRAAETDITTMALSRVGLPRPVHPVHRRAAGITGQNRAAAFRAAARPAGNTVYNPFDFGIGSNPEFQSTIYGGGDDKASDGSGSTGGLSQEDRTALITGAAQVLGTAASIITAAIAGNNAMARAQLEADTRIKLAELQQRQQASNDPAVQASAQAQIDTLTQLRAMLEGDKMSTQTMVLIGVAAVAVLGGLLILTRPRRNPVIYKRRKPGGMRTKQKYVPVRFVRAR